MFFLSYFLSFYISNLFSSSTFISMVLINHDINSCCIKYKQFHRDWIPSNGSHSDDTRPHPRDCVHYGLDARCLPYCNLAWCDVLRTRFWIFSGMKQNRRNISLFFDYLCILQSYLRRSNRLMITRSHVLRSLLPSQNQLFEKLKNDIELYRPSGSWISYQSSQKIVLINNSRTAWPT